MPGVRAKRDNLTAPAVEEWIAGDEERAGPLLGESREGRIDLVLSLLALKTMDLLVRRARAAACTSPSGPRQFAIRRIA